MVSSFATLHILKLSMKKTRRFIKSRVPKIEPCGSPDVMGTAQAPSDHGLRAKVLVNVCSVRPQTHNIEKQHTNID